jgi:hypothetical protein
MGKAGAAAGAGEMARGRLERRPVEGKGRWEAGAEAKAAPGGGERVRAGKGERRVGAGGERAAWRSEVGAAAGCRVPR